jgi:hypothetical protein
MTLSLAKLLADLTGDNFRLSAALLRVTADAREQSAKARSVRDFIEEAQTRTITVLTSLRIEDRRTIDRLSSENLRLSKRIDVLTADLHISNRELSEGWEYGDRQAETISLQAADLDAGIWGAIKRAFYRLGL